MATRFIRTYVAPLVRRTEWDAGLIASIRGGQGNVPPAGAGDAANGPAVAAGRPSSNAGEALPDDASTKASAKMSADTSGPGSEVRRRDYDPGASWQLDGDWDTYYSIGLLPIWEGH